MPKHIHADLISEYARLSHITDRPWEYFEVKFEVNGEWEPCTNVLSFSHLFEYRLKPRTIKIGEIEFPAPVSNPDLFKLEDKKGYFIPSIENGIPDHFNYHWDNDGTDLDRLNAGMIHLDKESAILHAKALISLTYKKE
ncbi:hypothetical protein [Xenorhabdus stockiae]|uniref:hypothetical protein n=1 Tax=Xenorhabdus stockiae TaxID=351614 RepID=UPI004063DD5F